MARGSRGPNLPSVRWTDSEGRPLWSDNPHRGMLLRRAELDESGNVVRESYSRVPLDRTLEEAMAWAKEAYS